MKNIITALIMMASIACFADRVAKYHKHIIGLDKIYLSDDLYNKDEIDNLLSHVKGTATIVTNRYPLFCIELNTDIQNYTITTNASGNIVDINVSDDRYSMSEWTSFELKASTNNFYSTAQTATLIITNNDGTTFKWFDKSLPGLSDSAKLLYWACSEFSTTSYEGSDTMRKYTCEKNIGTDPRTWKFFDSMADNTNKYPNRVMVLLDPSTFKHVPDNSWCNDHNEEIVWSYVRINGNGVEVDDNGNIVWRPIQPIKWYSELPRWAYKKNEIRVISKEEYLKMK